MAILRLEEEGTTLEMGAPPPHVQLLPHETGAEIRIPESGLSSLLTSLCFILKIQTTGIIGSLLISYDALRCETAAGMNWSRGSSSL